MQYLRQKGMLSLLLVVLASSFWGGAECQAAEVDFALEPGIIQIGSFFQGTDVKITAVIPAAAEAVIEVRGPVQEEHLVRKGRRWGLWMNTGSVTISGIPGLYCYATTTASLAERPDAPWGYAALQRQSHLTGDLEPEGAAFFFQQFIALKESNGLFQACNGSAAVAPGPPDIKRLTQVFRLPAQTPPGTYQVVVHILAADGTVLANPQKELLVTKVGMPSLVSSLAYQQRLLYGLLAVVIALAAGFLMGFIFKSKAAH